MHFLPLPSFFLADPSVPAHAAQATACLPLPPVQGEPDGWLLFAALVVCMAGRVATQPRQ
jgi:hypothetical protein